MAILEAEWITGPAKAVLEFAREARCCSDPTIEISILTFVRGAGENAFIRRVRDENIPIDLVRERGRLDRATISQLREAVIRRRPDIIWSNAVKSHFLVRMSGLHRKTRWVAFHHGYTTTSWITRLYNQLDRWSQPAAHRLITVCEAFARQIERRGVARKLIHVQPVPIRIDTTGRVDSREHARTRLKVNPGEIVLLSVGRLSREKGHAELLRAIARIHQAEPGLRLRLLLVGDGHEAARLRELSSRLGIEKIVSFEGHQAAVSDYYAAADIFVLPSHSEGSPNVLLEAIDAGLPVVATAVGGIPEMVTNETDALLVPGRDVVALSNAVLRLIHDEALRFRLKSHATSRLERWTPAKFFQGLASIFKEVAEAGR
jgi:glycosyltransferase involved in cell wall biosynthesis